VASSSCRVVVVRWATSWGTGMAAILAATVTTGLLLNFVVDLQVARTGFRFHSQDIAANNSKALNIVARISSGRLVH
jgi:hypothetical protein